MEPNPKKKVIVGLSEADLNQLGPLYPFSSPFDFPILVEIVCDSVNYGVIKIESQNGTRNGNHASKA